MSNPQPPNPERSSGTKNVGVYDTNTDASTPTRTGGVSVYDRPEKHGPSMMVLIGIALIVLVLIVAFIIARQFFLF